VVAQRAAELPGEMVAGLRPVDAVADQGTAAAREADACVVEEVLPAAHELVVEVVAVRRPAVRIGTVGVEAAVAAAQEVAVEHALHEPDAELAGQVS
jgi:hypothetical protein